MNFLEKEILYKIKHSIKRKDPNADVILFGSHARGDANSKSDWDILVLVDNDNFSRELEKAYRNEIYDLELEIEQPISTLLFTKKEWNTKYSYTPLFTNIQNQGIVL